MKGRKFKIVLAVVFLFLLDLCRPFHYGLCAEFLFLGLVFTALNYRPSFSVIMAIILGYFKDSIGGSGFFNTIELPLVISLIQAFKYSFDEPINRVYICCGAAVIHMILNFSFIGTFSFTWALYFLINSALFFYVLNYLLRRWIQILPVRSI